MATIPGKQAVSAGIVPPSLTCRCHTSWLGHIGHGGVGFSQLILDTFKSTEIVSIVTIVFVSISLAPGEIVDRSGAGIGLTDGVNNCISIRQNIVEYLEK